MKHEASELTAAILRGDFDNRPDLKHYVEVVLRDYELLWNVYIAASMVRDYSVSIVAGVPLAQPLLSSIETLNDAIAIRNRG